MSGNEGPLLLKSLVTALWGTHSASEFTELSLLLTMLMTRILLPDIPTAPLSVLRLPLHSRLVLLWPTSVMCVLDPALVLAQACFVMSPSVFIVLSTLSLIFRVTMAQSPLLVPHLAQVSLMTLTRLTRGNTPWSPLMLDLASLRDEQTRITCVVPRFRSPIRSPRTLLTSEATVTIEVTLTITFRTASRSCFPPVLSERRVLRTRLWVSTLLSSLVGRWRWKLRVGHSWCRAGLVAYAEHMCCCERDCCGRLWYGWFWW